MQTSDITSRSPFDKYLREEIRVHIDETRSWEEVQEFLKLTEYFDELIPVRFPDPHPRDPRVATVTFRRYHTTMRSEEVMREATDGECCAIHGQALLDCLAMYLRCHPEAKQRDAGLIVMVSLVKSQGEGPEPMVVELLYTPHDGERQLRLSYHGQAWDHGTIFPLAPKPV